MIRAGRSLAVREEGLAGIRSRLIQHLLSRGALTQGLWKGRNLFLKKVPPESGLHFRFPVPGLGKDRWLPQPAARSFSEQIQDGRLPSLSNEGSPRVALFVGCVANYLRPETAAAAVKLLEKRRGRGHYSHRAGLLRKTGPRRRGRRRRPVPGPEKPGGFFPGKIRLPGHLLRYLLRAFETLRRPARPGLPGLAGRTDQGYFRTVDGRSPLEA